MPILKNRDINPAANSKFWLPLRGFYYFIRHPQLWKVVLLPICCALLIDFVGVILLFALALVPQAELFIPIEGMPEAVAWLIAVVLVLLECLLLVFVTATIVFEHWGEKLFEKTLDIEGVPHVENDKCCDGDCWMDFFRFSLFVMLLPLHFIPCLGTVLFCYLNGFLAGWDYHQPFFSRMNWKFQAQYDFVTARKTDYTYFGFGSMMLNMIPIANFIFAFTNHVGAAIWAANIYKEMQMAAEQQERLVEAAVVVPQQQQPPVGGDA